MMIPCMYVCMPLPRQQVHTIGRSVGRVPPEQEEEGRYSRTTPSTAPLTATQLLCHACMHALFGDMCAGSSCFLQSARAGSALPVPLILAYGMLLTTVVRTGYTYTHTISLSLSLSLPAHVASSISPRRGYHTLCPRLQDHQPSHLFFRRQMSSEKGCRGVLTLPHIHKKYSFRLVFVAGTCRSFSDTAEKMVNLGSRSSSRFMIEATFPQR